MIYDNDENENSVSASDSVVKKLNFQSDALQKVYKNTNLATVLDNIRTLDFPAIYHQGNDKVLYHLEKIRSELDKSSDEDRKDELRSKLRKYEPNIKVKFTIAITYLLQVAQDCGHDLMFKDGLIYCFNGRYWENIQSEIFKAFLAEVITKTGINEFQSLKADAQKDLYKQFLVSAFYSDDAEIEESTPVIINLKSNVFVCQNGNYEFRDFDKNDKLTYCLDFDYEPDAKIDKFQKFLDKVLPDEGMQNVLAEYCAYILTKNLKLEKALILLGAGANGKSTFGDILTALLGGKKNVCFNSLSDLCDSKGYYRTELSKYLLNFCSEFSTSYNSAILKQLISTEEVTARSVFEKPITIQNYCKFIFNANIIGKKDIERSQGFYRRLLILPFNVTIPEAERDPELAAKIINTELSGIFNWILKGLNRILKNKRFTITPEIEAVRTEFEKESDSVALFIEECGYVKDETTKPLRMKDLYDEYWEYTREKLKMTPVYRPEFKRRLRDNLNFKIKEKGTNHYPCIYCTKKPEKVENKEENGLCSIEENGEKLYYRDVTTIINQENNE